jgi:hypothetical protein
MTSEKNSAAEGSFQKQVESSMKMFQDTAASMAKAYGKQVEFATKMYSDVIEKSMGMNSTDTVNPARISEILNEIMRKSLESLSAISKSSLETIQELGSRSITPLFSKEKIDSIAQTYIKQAETISNLNQKYIATLTEQINSSASEINPILTKVAKEVEANFEASKTSMESVSKLYTSSLNESAASGKEFLGELNKHLNSMITANLKIWSGLTQTAGSQKTADKTTASESKTAVAGTTAVTEAETKTRTAETNKKASVTR